MLLLVFGVCVLFSCFECLMFGVGCGVPPVSMRVLLISSPKDVRVMGWGLPSFSMRVLLVYSPKEVRVRGGGCP